RRRPARLRLCASCSPPPLHREGDVMAIERLDTATLEALCGVLGDTGGGLTGSEIGGLLRQCQIDDVAPGITKLHRLYEALAARQQRDGVANNVLAFVQAAMHPA